MSPTVPRRTFLVSIIVVSLVSPTLAAPPITASLIQEVRVARDRLERALVQLDGSAARVEPALRVARRSMRVIDRAVDAYFHAPNLRRPTARPHALALREEIHGLFAHQGGLLVVHDDIVRFRPVVHRALARGCKRLGRRSEEARHLRSARLVSADAPVDLKALFEAYTAMGMSDAADEVKATLRRTVGR